MLNALSVIIPVYNGAAFIQDAVVSVLAQSWLPPQLEVILVEDGSSDDSLSLCRGLAAEHANVHCIAQGHNQGVAKARNTGVAAATYPMLAFLDQDDTWALDKLALQQTSLLVDPSQDILIGHQVFHLYGLTAYPKWFKAEWVEKPQIAYLFASMLISKSRFLQVGWLDESYRFGGDDVEWFARAKDGGLKVGILPDVLVHRKIHARNTSQKTRESNLELLTLLRRKLERQRET